jgi:hypothetical protein
MATCSSGMWRLILLGRGDSFSWDVATNSSGMWRPILLGCGDASSGIWRLILLGYGNSFFWGVATQHDITEERRPQPYRRENQISRKNVSVIVLVLNWCLYTE